MVRNYKPKTETTWTKEDMENAIDKARRTKNIKAAVRHYKIPYTTLRYHISGKVSGEYGRGHPTVLTADEEREIVEACVIFAEWGFGLGRREVEGIIQNYLLTIFGCCEQDIPIKSKTCGNCGLPQNSRKSIEAATKRTQWNKQYYQSQKL